MSVFRYRAINAQGRPVAGEIQAANAVEARERLAAQSLLPQQVSRKLLFTASGGQSQLLLFVQSLHTLLQTGSELLTALSITHGRMKAGPLTDSLARVITAIRAGHRPSAALPTTLASMARCGLRPSRPAKHPESWPRPLGPMKSIWREPLPSNAKPLARLPTPCW